MPLNPLGWWTIFFPSEEIYDRSHLDYQKKKKKVPDHCNCENPTFYSMLNFCSLKLHHVRSLKKMLACFALKLFPFLLLCDSDPPHSLCSFVILQAAWLFQPLFPSFCQQVIIPLNFASKGITLTSSWKSCFLWQNSGCLNFLFKDPRSAFVPWVPYSLCWTSSPLVFYERKGSYRSNTVCSRFQSCQFPCQACAGTCMHPYSWLWLCALFCLLLRRVEYFKPRMSRHKYKSSRDVAGAAKKCQVMMMETKVNRFEGVQWQEEEEISESEKIHKTWKGQKIVFIWGGIVSFWVTKPECRPVHEGRPVSEQQQLFRMQYSCYHVIYDEK